MYVVSACLLGANCKYNGGNNDNEAVKAYCEGHRVLAVCPETEGGLSIPRSPAEQQKDGSVKDINGKDVTEEFCRGAERCLEKVMTLARQQADGGATDKKSVHESIDTETLHESADTGSVNETSIPEDVPELAILKARSPSCGSGKVYDGTFTGTLIDGDGCFAKLLKERGISVITEEDLKDREDR